MLTRAEIMHFRIFGWVVLRALLDGSEVDCLRDEIDRALRDAYGNAYGYNTRDDLDEESPPGNVLPLMSECTPLSMCLVADDTRLWSAGEHILGSVTLACPALGECLVGDTPWHTDPGIGEPWVRFRTYLEPRRADDGALRFVPGSQAPLYAEQLESYRADARAAGMPNLAVSIPFVAVETDPGDVIAFDPRTHHSSTGGQRRLAWNVDYVSLPDATDDDARERTCDLVRELSSWPHPERWPVWDHWLAARPRSTERQRAISRLALLGVIDNDG